MSSVGCLKSEYDLQRNNKLVWDETTRILMDLFDNVWGDRSEIVVDHFLDITLPVRFLCLVLTLILITSRWRSLSSAAPVVYAPFQLFIVL